MGYFDDSSKHINELGEAFAKNSALMNELGLTKSSDYPNTVAVTLKFCETETLLHIADELKRIADSLEKLTTPMSSFADKGALKVKENKEDDNHGISIISSKNYKP